MHKDHSTEPSLGAALRDLFPFGKEYDAHKAVPQPPAAGDVAKPQDKEYASALCREGDDLLSKEAFQRYKNREISINTKTNFLTTLNGYLGMTTRALGGLAVLTFAASTPLVTIIPGVAAGTAAAAAGALLPISLAAVGFALVTLAIGQYTTRMQTGKNTDNTDWFQRRSAQMVGREVARATGLGQGAEARDCDIPRRTDWSEKHAARSTGESWQAAVRADDTLPRTAQL